MRIRLLVCVAAVALAAVACGSVTVEVSSDTADTAVDDTADTAAAPVDSGEVPDAEMIDIHTGQAVNLQSVVDGSTPLLFWFWAPH